MKYKYKPKTKEELIEAIEKEIYEVQGTPDNPNWQADLNCIDTSLITNMSKLFSSQIELNNFNGNISEWDVSNVTNMDTMFYGSKFNQDISKWNVSNVKNMASMFEYSRFNQDISNWNIKNVEYTENMFEQSAFNKDIGNWLQNLKEDTRLKNISVSVEYFRLPDKVKYKETIENIKNYLNSLSNLKEKLKYEVQVIDRLDNKQFLNEFTNMFQKDLKEYLKQLKEKYKNRQSDIIKNLILKNVLDIIKHTNNKELIIKLLNGKDISNNLDMNYPA